MNNSIKWRNRGSKYFNDYISAKRTQITVGMGYNMKTVYTQNKRISYFPNILKSQKYLDAG